MRHRRKRLWKVVLSAIVVMGVGAWYLLRSHESDPYQFLAGRSPTDVTVRGPGSWGPEEWRTYSWKEDWRQVSAQASRELPKFGLTKEPQSDFPNSETWMGGKIDGGPCGIGTDHGVRIALGRAQPLPLRDLTDGNPEWVTVFVTSDIDDNWVNLVRYTFFAYHD
ncbi:MAG: hypothetical protein K8R88_03740 [Armatimonadetes bacterium]|nr:hypothetical protein [Armatimonadota bacterium]